MQHLQKEDQQAKHGNTLNEAELLCATDQRLDHLDRWRSTQRLSEQEEEGEACEL